MSKENNQQQFKDLIKRLDHLEMAVFGNRNNLTKQIQKEISLKTKVNFDMPLIAFVKKHTKGMSGPKKFVLLLSWFAKGDLKKEVSLEEISKNWNKMTAKSLLGGKFNRFYPSEARSNDWVNLKRRGFYILRPSWYDIFNEKSNK